MIVKSGVILMLVVLTECQRDAPNIAISLRALRPKGFRAYITAEANETQFLFFNAILYEDMEKAINSGSDIGLVFGAATRQAGDAFKWIFEDLHVPIDIGTVIRYGVFIPEELPTGANEYGQANLTFTGKLPDYQLFRVTALQDPLAPPPHCLPSVTKVRGKQVCAGDVIFEDNFDTLQEDVWQIEQYIPTDHPENPFVSYQSLTSDPNVFVREGKLHIEPKLQENLMRRNSQSIQTGTLDLTDGCTRRQCSKVAFGPDILPPIVSGRLTSMPFAFTYGIVHIRAKFPRGEWLYPELLVEPLFKKYSGEKDLANILKVAKITEDYVGVESFLNDGMNRACQPHEFNRTYMIFFDRTEDFHEYKLKWTPDTIELSADDTVYARADMRRIQHCFKDIFPGFGPDYHDFRHLTLGLAVGGTSMFSDSVVTNAGHAKPWRNVDAKASLNFWRNKHRWMPTWASPGLEIDFVKVTAL
ncbi:beta-1,3-glucan-binding protein [Bicyclus anynana]|uniref:Beta-1,3-glucan-binding protein n=1 Tax=Bicyclus anynana TaxID=110368 RepID=A0ABM3LRV1_BICAN|nr:beta-1,3-glucan-binding protein [Bicyclus anynana]